jgi:hypothetical protein
MDAKGESDGDSSSRYFVFLEQLSGPYGVDPQIEMLDGLFFLYYKGIGEEAEFIWWSEYPQVVRVFEALPPEARVAQLLGIFDTIPYHLKEDLVLTLSKEEYAAFRRQRQEAYQIEMEEVKSNGSLWKQYRQHTLEVLSKARKTSDPVGSIIRLIQDKSAVFGGILYRQLSDKERGEFDLRSRHHRKRVQKQP